MRLVCLRRKHRAAEITLTSGLICLNKFLKYSLTVKWVYLLKFQYVTNKSALKRKFTSIFAFCLSIKANQSERQECINSKMVSLQCDQIRGCRGISCKIRGMMSRFSVQNSLSVGSFVLHIDHKVRLLYTCRRLSRYERGLRTHRLYSKTILFIFSCEFLIDVCHWEYCASIVFVYASLLPLRGMWY